MWQGESANIKEEFIRNIEKDSYLVKGTMNIISNEILFL